MNGKDARISTKNIVQFAKLFLLPVVRPETLQLSEEH